jgi:8-oxo-dGTP diphosphatase
MQTITTFVSENILYLLLAVLLLNMFQRRYQEHARAKRFATLYVAILILALMVGTVLIVYFELPDVLFLPLLAVTVLIGYRYRAKVFPFRLTCRSCGEKLSGKRMLFYDSNTCEKCSQTD